MTFTLDPLPRTATPSDYTRILFDPKEVPAKRIVGLLACQRDPLLRSLTTTLLSARPATIAAPPPPKGKNTGGKKKGSANGGEASESNTSKGKLWEVELNDTVIFPEGGGQPADTGKLTITEPNGGLHSFVIEGCLRRKLDSVHLVRVPEGEESLFEGIEGKEVEITVDWERRMDHMTIHTAQHLLSAILDVAPYTLPTLSWSMHPHPSLETPYVELSRALTPAEAEDVERRCQALIDQGTKVWVDISVQGDQTERFNAADGERESRGLPKDYAGGVIRHINIENTDRNACCGTQCPDLSLISSIHILPPTTASSSATKLFFTAGPRATRFLTGSSRSLTSAAQVVGTGRQDLVERLEKFENQRREAVDNVKGLRGELIKLVIERVVNEGRDGKGVVWLNREERSTNDFEFLGLIAGGYLQSTTTEAEKPIIILTSAVQGSQTLLLIQSPDADLAKEVNEKAKKGLEGRVKGGGAKGRFMCKVDGKWGKGEIGLIKGIVEELRAGRA